MCIRRRKAARDSEPFGVHSIKQGRESYPRGGKTSRTLIPGPAINTPVVDAPQAVGGSVAAWAIYRRSGMTPRPGCRYVTPSIKALIWGTSATSISPKQKNDCA